MPRPLEAALQKPRSLALTGLPAWLTFQVCDYTSSPGLFWPVLGVCGGRWRVAETFGFLPGQAACVLGPWVPLVCSRLLSPDIPMHVNG